MFCWVFHIFGTHKEVDHEALTEGGANTCQQPLTWQEISDITLESLAVKNELFPHEGSSMTRDAFSCEDK